MFPLAGWERVMYVAGLSRRHEATAGAFQKGIRARLLRVALRIACKAAVGRERAGRQAAGVKGARHWAARQRLGLRLGVRPQQALQGGRRKYTSDTLVAAVQRS